MKKKILIISLFILFIVGCKANYSLDIKDEKIKETLEVIEEDDELINTFDESNTSFYDYSKKYGEELDIDVNYYDFYSQEECEDNCEYYDKEFIDNNDEVGFILSHSFDFTDYSNSSIANEIIPSFSSSFDGRYLEISGGSSTNFTDSYKNLDEINIIINTTYKVKSTNLSQIGNGKYKWTIKNDGTSKSKKLFIKIDTKEIVENDEENTNEMLIIIIFIVIGLIIALIYIKINEKKQ